MLSVLGNIFFFFCILIYHFHKKEHVTIDH